MIIQSQKYSYCCFSTIYLTHIQSCVEHKPSLRAWSFGTEISCQSDIVSFHHPPDSTPNLSPNNPKGKSGKSQFMGHVSQSLVLSGANKPLSARRLVSLLCTSSKLEIDFCLELKGLQPFHCFSSVCVCISVCVFVCIHVCACSSMCICSRPQNVLRISLVFFRVSVFVCRCYLCNWIWTFCGLWLSKCERRLLSPPKCSSLIVQPSADGHMCQ